MEMEQMYSAAGNTEKKCNKDTFPGFLCVFLILLLSFRPF